MKILSTARIFTTLLLCLVVIGFSSCTNSNSPSSVRKVAPTNLKELDKSTFLNMIDSVAHVLGRKDSASQQAADLINKYHSIYKFTTNDQKQVSDTGNVFVNFNKKPHSVYIRFGLTENFQKQISYRDLSDKFGKWNVNVLQKEPVLIPVTFAIKGVGNVNVFVRSKTWPDESGNVIYDITLIRM